MANLKKLTNRHYNFINFYFSQGQVNAALAYRKAFNMESQEISKKKAHILLQDPLIQEEIKRQQEELSKKCDIKKERIIKELVNVLDSNIMDYLDVESYIDTIKRIDEEGELVEEEVIKYKYLLKDLKSLSIDKQKCIKSIEMTKFGPKITLMDKDASIEKLNKMLGLYEQTISFDTRIDTSSLSNLSFAELEKLLKG